MCSPKHKKCPVCSRLMNDPSERRYRSNQVTCSERCRAQHRRMLADKRILRESPKKICLNCGSEFGRHRSSRTGVLQSVQHFNEKKCCSKSCGTTYAQARMDHSKTKASGPRPHLWRPASTIRATQTFRGRAKRIIESSKKLKVCALCGCEPGNGRQVDIHHLDHDVSNNTLENLQYLCRSCHAEHHGELRNRNSVSSSNSMKSCILKDCNGYRYHNYSFCNKHLMRWQRYGDPTILFEPARNKGEMKQISGPAVNPKFLGRGYGLRYLKSEVKNLQEHQWNGFFVVARDR